MLFIATLILLGRFFGGRFSYLICIFNWTGFVVQYHSNKNSVGFVLFIKENMSLEFILDFGAQKC